MTANIHPYEPSGIEWPDDVPAHWEMRRATYSYGQVDERSDSVTSPH